MDKRFKRTLLYIAFGVILYALVINIKSVWGFFDNLTSLIFPVLLGFIIAFVFNVPMKGFKKLFGLILKKSKRKPPEKLVDVASMLLVFILVGFLLWLTVMLAVPSLLETVDNIAQIVDEKLPEIIAWLEKYNVDPKVISEFVDFIDIDHAGDLSFNIGSIVGPVFSTLASVLSTAVNVIFALVVCAYALLSKAEMTRQIRRISYSVLPERVARQVGHVYTLVRDTYSKFLSAQCIEACILGVMMFIAFMVFRIPYAGLVAVLTALFAFLPYIGAFGSCFVGAFLTLVSEPDKVILCIVVYTVVQFTENQFIYPHVVGNSIGLSPIWTLVAALVGGSLMGLFGMIFFIPLASVIYTLLGELTEARLKKKNIVIEDGYESFPSMQNTAPPEESASESGVGAENSAECTEENKNA